VTSLLIAVLSAFTASPSQATSNFTNKTTADGLGNITVLGVYAEGTTVYAATNGGLSTSTDGGTTFTNKTTADGLGGNTVLGVYAVGSSIYAATNGGLSISTGGGSQGEGLSLPQIPAPIIQQIGKVPMDSCEAAASRSLDWFGVASGRWSESWAQWANDGAGGAVCTRTLVYSSSQSRWVVA